MSRSEHYAAAERLLEQVAKLRDHAATPTDGSEYRRELLAEAQVHAALAGAS